MVTKDEWETHGTSLQQLFESLTAFKIVFSKAIKTQADSINIEFEKINIRIDTLFERLGPIITILDAFLKKFEDKVPEPIREDVDYEKSEIRHASPGIEGSAAIKDIPKGDYIRYKDKHYELKAAPEIETEKGINLYIEGRGESFWFPKAAFEDTKYQMGLVKWYKVKSTHKWVLEKNGLIGEEE